MNPLSTALLGHFLNTAANAAAAQLDGNPETKAKDELKKGLTALLGSQVQDRAIDKLAETVITPEQFGENEKRAEELLKSITAQSIELFSLVKPQ